MPFFYSKRREKPHTERGGRRSLSREEKKSRSGRGAERIRGGGSLP